MQPTVAMIATLILSLCSSPSRALADSLLIPATMPTTTTTSLSAPGYLVTSHPVTSHSVQHHIAHPATDLAQSTHKAAPSGKATRTDIASDIATAVAQQAHQLMQQQQIPGMAIAVLWQGQRSIYTFGLADVAAQRPVTPHTLFEIGSVTKTFAGVLSAMAIARGDIQLHDPVQQHWPALRGAQWQPIQLLHLATYTAGGLPLQFPAQVRDPASMLAYYQQWQPAYAPGEQRVYANTSIGLLAHLAVKKTNRPFAEVLKQQLLTPLALTQSYSQVPPTAQAHYAFGYADGHAVRHRPSMLSDEAGGMTSSVQDLALWLQLHLTPTQVADPQIRHAINLAQQRYAHAGQMYQGLGWEMLDYPTSISALQAMTDPAFTALSRAKLIQPAAAAEPASWVHKTGSTRGFAAYVAMIPSQHAGIVILANKGYPNALRVRFAHHILQGLINGQIQRATPSHSDPRQHAVAEHNNRSSHL